MNSFTVYRLRDGGYVIREGRPTLGEPSEPIYACTELSAALKYLEVHFVRLEVEMQPKKPPFSPGQK